MDEEEEEETSSSSSSLRTLTSSASSSEEAGPSTTKTQSKLPEDVKIKASSLQFTEQDAKKWYNDRYREMFNHELTSELLSFERLPPRLRSSDNRLSLWSSEEKERFFKILNRHGRIHFDAVFKDAQDKSEAEMLDYLFLLQRAAAEMDLHDKNFLGRQYYRIPTAVELSDECCRRLEVASRALTYHQLEHELAVAKAADPQNGIITADSLSQKSQPAKETKEESGVAKVQTTPEQQGIQAALDLFKVENWLKLSTQVFMNSGDPDLNWTSFASLETSPAILGTALSDFRNIAETVTRRIVATAIFHARSRLRASDVPNRLRAADTVRSVDVKSALDALNWLPKKHNYWVNVPRRNKLRVYDAPRRLNHLSKRSRLLSYEEVEARLRLPVRLKQHTQHIPSRSQSPVEDPSENTKLDPDNDDDSGLGTPAPLSHENLQRHTEFSQSSTVDDDSQANDPVEVEETDASSSTLSSLLPSPPPKQPPRRRRKDWVQQEDELIDAETKYLEDRDARRSAHEEARIWRAVFKRKRRFAATLSSESDSDSDRPHRKRRRANNDDDEDESDQPQTRRAKRPKPPPNRFPEQDAWREVTRPRPAWLDVGYIVPADAFADYNHHLPPADPAAIDARVTSDSDDSEATSSPSELQLGASALDESMSMSTSDSEVTTDEEDGDDEEEDEAGDGEEEDEDDSSENSTTSTSTALSRRSNPARSTRSQSPAYTFDQTGLTRIEEDDDSADEYEPDDD